MGNFLPVMMAVHILVHWLLLLGINRLVGYRQCALRCAIAAGIGGIYGSFCLLPNFAFLGNLFWRCVFLLLMGLIAYGFHLDGAKRAMLFILLSMALSGVATVSESGNGASAVIGGAVFFFISYFALRYLTTQQEYVEVELCNGGKQQKLLALRDTGNTLRDPVSGQNVLIADAKSAEVLLGLSKQQLHCPVETVASGVVRGLRLIPYRAVGQSNGMLVAIRMEHVRIGRWKGSAVVAFAPEGLGENHSYRALTGGWI